MKIKGETIQIREVVEVVLKSGNGSDRLKLKVCGYPIGIQNEYETLNPKPPVPEKATGKMIVGKGEEKKPDYTDAAWNKAYDKWTLLQQLYYLCKCVCSVNEITFESDWNTLAGLEKIPDELNAAGFSAGDIGVILEAIRGATTIEPKAIAEAAASLQ